MRGLERAPVFFLVLLLAGCGRNGGDQATSAAPPQLTPAAAANELDRIVEEYWDRYIELNPLVGTFNGDYRFNDRIENTISPQYLADTLALDKEFLARVEAIDATLLSGQDRLTHETFRLDRQLGIEGARYQNELLPVNQVFSLPLLFATMGSGSSLHPFQSTKDYEDWLKRVGDFEKWMNQAIENMRAGASKGIVQPRIVMERVLPQLASMIVEDPTRSLFYRPVANFPDAVPAADRERLKQAFVAAIRDKIVPSYRRVHDYVRDEYLAQARATVGLSALPQGGDWYAFLVKAQTTTSMTPGEIHQLGLKEVDRIRGEMESIMKKVGFKGDLPAFFAYLRKEPRFYFTKEEQLLDGYRDLKARVHAELPKLFAVMPKADFEIRPVEAFRAQSSAGASYQGATPDGKRPGVFYVNTYDLKSRPKYTMEAIYLHEAEPGHHFQGSIQQELEELPRFRRFGGYTAYSEGWGLYAESLGDELGLYTDPYNRFGALGTEIFRAVRLVVDTGIHARGWTREQAIEYMNANAPIGPADAISEIERYIAIPGQALAYKVGELKIKELRARARKALGAKFDVREFHTQVLTDGALPMDVLEAKINRWLESKGART
jgi:uncharacterized protein (DUF885 family)